MISTVTTLLIHQKFTMPVLTFSYKYFIVSHSQYRPGVIVICNSTYYIFSRNSNRCLVIRSNSNSNIYNTLWNSHIRSLHCLSFNLWCNRCSFKISTVSLAPVERLISIASKIFHHERCSLYISIAMHTFFKINLALFVWCAAIWNSNSNSELM